MATTWQQTGFRWRNDNGSESAATWYANLNTSVTYGITSTGTLNLRIRLIVYESGTTAATLTPRLYISKNGGSYAQITSTATNGCKVVDSTYLTDDAATTQQIGSNTFVAGRVDDVNGQCSATASIARYSETEVEFTLQFTGSQLTHNDYFYFRVFNSTTALSTYSQVPRITFTKNYNSSIDYDTSLSISKNISNSKDYDSSLVISKNITANRSYDTSLSISKQFAGNRSYDTSIRIFHGYSNSKDYDSSLSISKEISGNRSYDSSLNVSKIISNSKDYDSYLKISKYFTGSKNYDSSLVVSKLISNSKNYDSSLVVSKLISNSKNYDSSLLISKQFSSSKDYDTSLGINKNRNSSRDYDISISISKVFSGSKDYDTSLNIVKKSLIEDINDLNSKNPVIVCLKIDIPGNDSIFICNNNEPVTFQGNEYIPFGFSFNDLSTPGKGEVPSWQISIDNTSRAIERYMQTYDLYLKQNGINGNDIELNCYIVNLFDTSTSIFDEYFTLNSFSSNSKLATFDLGARSPFTWRYPRRRLIANFCPWKFKGDKCKYSGTADSCDKSLARCILLNNTANFGAFPGVGKGIRV